MRIKRVVVIIAIIACCIAAHAQREEVGQAVTYHDTTWYDRGFDFYIGGGMFWGGRQTALYYNGSRYNECNLNYIFDNEYRIRELLDAVVNKAGYSYISMSDELGYNEADLNMIPTYNLSACIGLGVRYKIRNNWAIALSYTFSRLTTTNKLLLTYTSISGNMYDAPELTLSGKEDRSMIDLSASYLFSGVHRIVKPFVELGVQFNYVKVKKFDAVLLDKKNNPVYTQTLMDYYQGQNWAPGMQAYDVIYGGPGFGASASVGLKLVINKFVSLDPTFYFCASRLHLEPYGNKVMSFNYGAMLRVVMNDFFFQNR